MDKNHTKSIETVITNFFKAKSAERGILRLSHGPQFANPGGTLGFFVSMILLLISVVSFIQGSFITGLVLLTVCMLVVGYFLDFQGIEIDTRNGKIRNYGSFWGLRSGEWYITEQFDQLRICQNSLLEKRALNGGSTYASSRRYDNHKFYTLYLVNNGKQFIKLHEDESIAKVRQLATKFSEFSNLYLHPSVTRRKPEIIGRWRIF